MKLASDGPLLLCWSRRASPKAHVNNAGYVPYHTTCVACTPACWSAARQGNGSGRGPHQVQLLFTRKSSALVFVVQTNHGFEATTHKQLETTAHARLCPCTSQCQRRITAQDRQIRLFSQDRPSKASQLPRGLCASSQNHITYTWHTVQSLF